MLIAQESVKKKNRERLFFNILIFRYFWHIEK